MLAVSVLRLNYILAQNKYQVEEAANVVILNLGEFSPVLQTRYLNLDCQVPASFYFHPLQFKFQHSFLTTFQNDNSLPLCHCHFRGYSFNNFSTLHIFVRAKIFNESWKHVVWKKLLMITLAYCFN
jgi:hypothetical protein